MNLIPYRIESTPEQPIDFFYHFYRGKKFMVYFENFEQIEFEELSAIGCVLVDSEQKIYDFDVPDFEKEDLKTVRLSFQEGLNYLLTKEVEWSLRMIDERMSQCKSIAEKKSVKETLLQQLLDLQKVIATSLTTANKYPANTKAIDYLINYIRKTYKAGAVRKAMKKNLTSFGYERDIALLQRIYHLYNEDFNFIDVARTSQKDFIAALTANNYSLHKSKIHFGCQTVIAVAILDTISKFFKNLKPQAIEQSEVFVTDEGNLLKSGNYRKSKLPINSKTVDREPIKSTLTRVEIKS